MKSLKQTEWLQWEDHDEILLLNFAVQLRKKILICLLFAGVQKACCEFLEQQLDPSNCLGIKTFAETHGCEELRKAAEKYILKHFVDLVDSEEFLQLDNEDVVSLIKCDNLTVSKQCS